MMHSTDKSSWDKNKVYIEVRSQPNDKGQQSCTIFWWGNSINTNFEDTWMGQGFVTVIKDRIRKYEDQKKEVVIFGSFDVAY